jgi:hypothetical protein
MIPRFGHTRCSTLVLEELAEQTLRGLLVAPALDENIENEAVPVDALKGVPYLIKMRWKALGREPNADDVEAVTWGCTSAVSRLSGVEYIEAIAAAHAAGRKMSVFLTSYDVILSTTLTVETHENWLEQYRYLNMDDGANTKRRRCAVRPDPRPVQPSIELARSRTLRTGFAGAAASRRHP